jgi:serine/threonine protein kinase
MSPDRLPNVIGTTLAHYEITSHLGSGGMGVVYQAIDTKLGRNVAIKLLSEAFSHDSERVARFEREARMLASLNHPNVAAIHGLEDFEGRKFLVMELVPGETLAERINRGPIPVEETLGIAKQIADAVEAAHEKGVIHRDLKPANIKLTRDGTVKVLDFGLAKVRQTAGSVSFSNSPTMVTAESEGTIIGTASYMSPEQARGQEADRIADVWAFGCVVYEMLTGRRVFEGETTAEILGGVLKVEPDWRRVPTETPAAIRRLLRRCLQKEGKRRLHDFADVRIEIDEVKSAPQLDGEVAQRPSRRREQLAWSAFALVTLIAVLESIWFSATVPSLPPAPEMRVEITTPASRDPLALAISSDGRKIVFLATSEGRSQLWLRSLDSVSAHPLKGTDDASLPFWSPDSRSIGFFADGKLKRIDINTGLVQALADAPVGRGGSWNSDGVILFSPSTSTAIFRVSATGGEVTALTRLEPQQQSHRHPQFLPDGRHFLCYVQAGPEARGVYVGGLDRSEMRRLLDADVAAVYRPSGQLLFVRQGTLFTQNFDPIRLELSGSPSPVAEELAVDAVVYVAALSASVSGPIVYRAGSAGGTRQFAWFDRSGREIAKVGSPDNNFVLNPSLSPDQRRVALYRTVKGNSDVWLLETERGVISRFTFDAANDNNPLWSPDGNYIVFGSNRNGVYDLYRKPAAASGSEIALLVTAQNKSATDWSPDGRFILYRSQDPKMSYDIWALPLDEGRKPFAVVQTKFEERDGQFSPDGKWIAYQSNESGRFEIYIQRFPGPGRRWPISTNGGAQVRWRSDGKELFYIALDGRLMASPIRLSSNDQTVEAGTPIPLFDTRVGGAVLGVNKQQYMVSSDGQRFLMNAFTEEAASPITVILNWQPKP